MSLYVVRHKVTGNILSQYFIGGSYWNGEPDPKDAPRFFNLRGAKSFISQWAMGEHKQVFVEGDSRWEGYSEHEVKDVGRKRTDCEILPVTISYGDPL